MNTYEIMHVHTTIHMHMHVYIHVYTWKYRYAQRIGDRAYRLVSEGDDTLGGGASEARTNEDDRQRTLCLSLSLCLSVCLSLSLA